VQAFCLVFDFSLALIIPFIARKVSVYAGCGVVQ